MPKPRKPWPPFIVEIRTGRFFKKTRWPYHDFQDRLKYITYECGKSVATFSRMSTLEAQYKQGFRRPNFTERLLFEQE